MNGKNQLFLKVWLMVLCAAPSYGMPQNWQENPSLPKIAIKKWVSNDIQLIGYDLGIEVSSAESLPVISDKPVLKQGNRFVLRLYWKQIDAVDGHYDFQYDLEAFIDKLHVCDLKRRDAVNAGFRIEGIRSLGTIFSESFMLPLAEDVPNGQIDIHLAGGDVLLSFDIDQRLGGLCLIRTYLDHSRFDLGLKQALDLAWLIRPSDAEIIFELDSFVKSLNSRVYPVAFYIEGRVRQASDDFGEAIELFQRFIAAVEKNPQQSVFLSDAYYQLGRIFEKERKLDISKQMYSLASASIESSTELAAWLPSLRKSGRSIPSPLWIDVLYKRALIDWDLGKLDRATPELEEVGVWRASDDLSKQLFKLYLELPDGNKAFRLYKRLRRISPHSVKNLTLVNVALGKPYHFNVAPNFHSTRVTEDGDLQQLTDGNCDGTPALNPAFVGWQSVNPVEIIIDLKNETNRIIGIRANFNGGGYWGSIFFPRRVEYSLSLDGLAYQPLGVVVHDGIGENPDGKGRPEFKSFELPAKYRNGRFIKLVIYSDGRPIICDEIEVISLLSENDNAS